MNIRILEYLCSSLTWDYPWEAMQCDGLPRTTSGGPIHYDGLPWTTYGGIIQCDGLPGTTPGATIQFNGLPGTTSGQIWNLSKSLHTHSISGEIVPKRALNSAKFSIVTKQQKICMEKKVITCSSMQQYILSHQ